MERIACLFFDFPGLDRVACVFTTRRGGQSGPPFDSANLSLDLGDERDRVLANRAALQRDLGFRHWQECRQVHGQTLHFDPRPAGPGDGPGIEGDGLATARPGQALVVKTADCQPVLLAHRSGRFVAALHVGWRGNRAGFPALAAAAFCERYAVSPAEVMAVRGPSLGPTASRFSDFEAEFGPGFRDYLDPKAMTVDLWRLTRDQLVSAGLRPENVFGLDRCTMSDPDFFSYRRDRVTGRQAGLIWIRG
ncbi:MAG: polyphenol oxidase family protein [Desulfovibrionaceae bacterium]|nr:laccase domain-containing protein [Desulfovibrionaceae bacterium]MDD4952009.1 polyphenol oxidase family protein [Desulfovibrionaceae bacterium]